MRLGGKMKLFSSIRLVQKHATNSTQKKTRKNPLSPVVFDVFSIEEFPLDDNNVSQPERISIQPINVDFFSRSITKIVENLHFFVYARNVTDCVLFDDSNEK